MHWTHSYQLLCIYLLILKIHLSKRTASGMALLCYLLRLNASLSKNFLHKCQWMVSSINFEWNRKVWTWENKGILCLVVQMRKAYFSEIIKFYLFQYLILALDSSHSHHFYFCSSIQKFYLDLWSDIYLFGILTMHLSFPFKYFQLFP